MYTRIPDAKKKEQEEIKKLSDEFKKKGGVVQVIETEEYSSPCLRVGVHSGQNSY